MTIRKILYLPDTRLRQLAKPVKNFDDNLQILIDDMFETMYQAKGVGLAAPQIGISLCLSVVDILGDKSQQLVLVNPKIIATYGTQEYQEGCLSIPGAFDKIIRAQSVTISAQDRFGQPFEMDADGLLGECFQHEIDHLNGKLFIDLLSPLKRMMIRKKLSKFLKHGRTD